MKTKQLAAWSVVAVAAGGVMLAAAFWIGSMKMGTSGWSVAQAHGVCSSAFGEIVQAGSRKALAGCGRAASLELAHGWLVILGVLALAAGAAGLVVSQRQPSAPVGGGGDGVAGPPPLA